MAIETIDTNSENFKKAKKMANKTPIRLREVGDTIEIIVDKKEGKECYTLPAGDLRKILGGLYVK